MIGLTIHWYILCMCKLFFLSTHSYILFWNTMKLLSFDAWLFASTSQYPTLASLSSLLTRKRRAKKQASSQPVRPSAGQPPLIYRSLYRYSFQLGSYSHNVPTLSSPHPPFLISPLPVSLGTASTAIGVAVAFFSAIFFLSFSSYDPDLLSWLSLPCTMIK